MKRKAKVPAPKAPAENRAAKVLYAIVAVIALIGVVETTYLTAMHLSGANVVCVASNGCSQVLRSAWASVKGVPLAALGALAYFAAFSAAALSAFGHRKAPAFLASIVGVMFLATLGLLYVQAFVLHAFCDYCLFSAAMIFVLAGVLIAAPRRP